MPASKVDFTRPALKQFEKLPLNLQKRIGLAVASLETEPFLGAKLHGELAGFYKLRVGDYRIVYAYASKVLTVVKIEHRQGVYK